MFWDELDRFLLRHFTASDAKLVAQRFKQVCVCVCVCQGEVWVGCCVCVCICA